MSTKQYGISNHQYPQLRLSARFFRLKTAVAGLRYFAMVSDIPLVLEGGGMRGVFTAGVLDRLMDEGIYFPYVIGVSAGASNGLSYASRQRGRTKFCNIDALSARNYIGLRFLLRQGCIMDYDYLFGDLPKKIYPYDFDAYLKSGEFNFVLTDCLTGKAEYVRKPLTFDAVLSVCRASCSLPYVCPVSKINGVPYLDGGISDAIPVGRALSDGFKKCVVVLTRNKGYVKPSMYNPVAGILYRKYPNLVESLRRAHERYNKSLSYAEYLESEGKAVVIRPQNPLEVDRLERNPARLTRLYDEGYMLCGRAIPKILSL